ncbi:MAG TPA: EF-hand domain-containing protein [Gemmataceae bacterium]|nr:EF-hand domain-containing protein [Gemmataceae bacterium]
MARWIGTAAVALTAVFMLNGVHAQDTQKKKLDSTVIFKKLDANSDGKLSKDEFLKLADHFKNRDKAREKLGASYTKFDTSMTGLTPDQFRMYLDSVRRKTESRAIQSK